MVPVTWLSLIDIQRIYPHLDDSTLIDSPTWTGYQWPFISRRLSTFRNKIRILVRVWRRAATKEAQIFGGGDLMPGTGWN